jgi:hypothetical protein
MMGQWMFRLWAIALSVFGASIAIKGGFMNNAPWWDGVMSVISVVFIINFAVSAWRRA